MEILHCYALGNGTLCFTYVENGNCTGRQVTLEVANAYLQTEEARSLREENWRAIIFNGMPCLIPNVKRVNQNTLDINGTYYTYKVEDKMVPPHIWAHQVDVRTTKNRTKVLNSSIKNQITFFLNHEKELTKTIIIQKQMANPLGPTVHEVAEQRLEANKKKIKELQEDCSRQRRLLSVPLYKHMLESERVANSADVFLPEIK